MNTTIFLRRRATRRMSGWSLIELTIILVVLAILCAILAPVIGRFIRNARIIRCREDVQAIGCAIWMMIEDTGIGYLRYNGRQRNDCHIILAVGDGHIPVLGSGGDSRWTAPVDLERKDFLEYHLVLNQPGANTNRRYYTPLDLGFNSEFGWRGPYITAPLIPTLGATATPSTANTLAPSTTPKTPLSSPPAPTAPSAPPGPSMASPPATMTSSTSSMAAPCPEA